MMVLYWLNYKSYYYQNCCDFNIKKYFQEESGLRTKILEYN